LYLVTARAQHQRRRSVPQVMQAHGREPRGREQLVEGLAQVGRIQSGPDRRREDEVAVLPGVAYLDAYEGLLEKNAQDVKGGAGQYFTPRALIKGIVEVVRPQAGEVICDPACGTGGFLLSAHDYIVGSNPTLDKDQKKHLKLMALRGIELVDGVARPCAMNLLLHGVGPTGTECGRAAQRLARFSEGIVGEPNVRELEPCS
jgi:N-6 DNA Methylase